MTTLFIADISSHQRGLSVRQLRSAGFSAVIIKCSQGGGYINPLFAGWVDEAKSLGFRVSSYHFLEPGNWDAQAAEIHRADPDPTIPIWLDAEAGATRTDAIEVANRLRRLGQRLAGFYGPRPPAGYGGWWRPAYLSDPSGQVSDVYRRQGGDSSSAWVGQDIWQFCQWGQVPGFAGDVDFSAYRGSLSTLDSTGWFWGPTPAPVPAPIPTPTPEETMYVQATANSTAKGADGTPVVKVGDVFHPAVDPARGGVRLHIPGAAKELVFSDPKAPVFNAPGDAILIAYPIEIHNS